MKIAKKIAEPRPAYCFARRRGARTDHGSRVPAAPTIPHAYLLDHPSRGVPASNEWLTQYSFAFLANAGYFLPRPVRRLPIDRPHPQPDPRQPRRRGMPVLKPALLVSDGRKLLRPNPRTSLSFSDSGAPWRPPCLHAVLGWPVLIATGIELPRQSCWEMGRHVHTLLPAVLF